MIGVVLRKRPTLGRVCFLLFVIDVTSLVPISVIGSGDADVLFRHVLGESLDPTHRSRFAVLHRSPRSLLIGA